MPRPQASGELTKRAQLVLHELFKMVLEMCEGPNAPMIGPVNLAFVIKGQRKFVERIIDGMNDVQATFVAEHIIDTADYLREASPSKARRHG